jgi:hypothetical protein
VILLLLVFGGWFLDAQLVPEFRDCDPSAAVAELERCVEAQKAQAEAAHGYADRTLLWRAALLVVLFGTVGAMLVTALLGRRDA